jgi:Fic family protein
MILVSSYGAGRRRRSLWTRSPSIQRRPRAETTFNDRQRKIINQLLNGLEGKVTSSKWAKLAKCSQDTALRDIADLVRKGVLAKDAAGGRSTSYGLVEAP